MNHVQCIVLIKFENKQQVVYEYTCIWQDMLKRKGTIYTNCRLSYLKGRKGKGTRKEHTSGFTVLTEI